MKLLSLLIFFCVSSLAQPHCPKPCDCTAVVPPKLFNQLGEIYTKVNNECIEVEEITVTPSHPDDPCGFQNIASLLAPIKVEGADIYHSLRFDPLHKPGDKCDGDLVENDNNCFRHSNDFIATRGGSRWGMSNDGNLFLELRQNPKCHKTEIKCFKPAKTSIPIPLENVFDGQQRPLSVIDCKPANCYSIIPITQDPKQASGIQRSQLVTVTRLPNGSVETKLYVNLSSTFTTTHTYQPYYGVGLGKGWNRDIANPVYQKKADTFVSCDVPYSERKISK